MKIYAQTHIGLVQKKNEDRHLFKRLFDGSTLLFVADGLGGNGNGDVAAEMIKIKMATVQEIEIGQERNHLQSIALELDERVSNRADQDILLEGMGSTFIAVLIRKAQVYWVHVGDSRLYHFHLNHLHQITQDQTLSRFLFEEGEITAKEYETHYARTIMDQWIGCGCCEPETGEFTIEGNDQLLITSDGLFRYVSHTQLETIMRLHEPVPERVHQLIKSSLTTGGRDNITVILSEIENTS